MLGDNDALYKTIRHEGHSARVRHYERATLLFKRAILLLILSAFKISDQDMAADIFTKPLDKATYFRHRNIIMNIHGDIRAALENSLANIGSGTKRTVAKLCGSNW